MRKADCVRNGGEGPVGGGEQQFGALNPPPDDILMRRKAGGRFEETREVVGGEIRDRREF